MSTKKRTPRVRPGSARAQLPEPRPTAESGTGVAAYDAFLAALDRAAAPAPDDLPAALKALSEEPPLPLHNIWTLLRLISQYQRHDWALRNIFSPLIRDEKEVVWSFMHRLCLEGRVPNQPDWYFGLDHDASPACWYARNRQTSELITVEARPVILMDWADDYDTPVWIDEPLCLGDVDPDRAACRWMVEKFCVSETWISEDLYPRREADRGGLRAAEYVRAVQRLVQNLWRRRDAVATFHTEWTEPGRRVWLAALLGDWLAAHAAALTLGDPAIAAQTEPRAEWWLGEQEGMPTGVMRSEYVDDAALETLLRHGFEPLVQAARESCKGEGGSIGHHALCLALEKDLPGWEAEAERVFYDIPYAHDEPRPSRGAYYLLRRGIKTHEVILKLAQRHHQIPKQFDYWNRDALLQVARHDEKLGKKLLRQALRAPVEAIRVCAAAGLAALDRPWAVELLEDELEKGQPKTVRACCRLAFESLRAQGSGEHVGAGPALPASDGTRRFRWVRRVRSLDDSEWDDDDSDPHDGLDATQCEYDWGRGDGVERGPYMRYYGTLRELFEDQVEKARRWLNDWQSSKPWLC